ncbi:aKG-HExxH-type peptide beta-hydroxylase [Chitinimonas sp. PSY-7]|uniref:aKG-HExxH-type peptide beta-hydroxylase n=1 Tax=Chitinimonas sp. PSY-7 TaxID=3459088 RepID=UPI00404015A5
MHIDWQPNAEIACVERSKLAQRFLGFLKKKCPQDIDEYVSNEKGLDIDLMLDPSLISCCYEINSYSDDHLSGATDRVIRAIQSASESQKRRTLYEQDYAIPFDLKYVDTDFFRPIERGLEMARQAVKDAELQSLSRELDDEEKRIVANACKIIREVWPEAYTELYTYVKRLHFFDSKTAIGFVDFEANGTIFLRYKTINNPVKLAEEILHEAGHVKLNCTLANSPLFLNDPAETYSSPLRRDPRPMFGIFHQVFVLARLHQYYTRLIKNGQTVSTPIDLIESHIEQAIKVVTDHAKLTPSGKSMVDSIMLYAAHIKSA